MTILKGLLILILLFSQSLTSLAATSDEEYSKGEKVKIRDLRTIRPTQFHIGGLEVEARVKELKQLMTREGEEGVKEYLKKHRVEIVVGPNGSFWLVDGHHHAKALSIVKKNDSSFKDIPLYGTVIKVWDDLSTTEFEKAMKEGNKKGKKDQTALVYLKDPNGKQKSFKNLPKSLYSLTDSPWRSLIWLLKEKKILQKVENIPFQEFKVAEYLQKKMKLPKKMNKEGYQTALEQATRLIQSAKPEALPGFKKGTAQQCAKVFERLS